MTHNIHQKRLKQNTQISNIKPQVLPLDHAEVIKYPGVFSESRSQEIFAKLMQEVSWEQHQIKIFGKIIPEPRLSQYYGERPYPYSGFTRKPLPWIPVLQDIKETIEPLIQVKFNAVFLNLYRDGNDSVGWHSDNQKLMGVNPIIGSVSFGATRKFVFRRRDDYSVRYSLELANGDLLIMAGQTQHFWHHSIPKTSPKIAAQIPPRINLTYRIVF